MSAAPVRVETPPAQAAVSTDDLKAHLFVEHDADNTLIASYSAAAQEKVEGWTGARLITQTVEWTLPRFTDAIQPPTGPLQSVAAISYLDPDGESVDLTSDDWRIGLQSWPPAILPARGTVWPETLNDDDAVTIQAVVGYGDTGAAAPQSLIAAIKYLVTQMYRDRTGGASQAAYTRAKQMTAGHAF